MTDATMSSRRRISAPRRWLALGAVGAAVVAGTSGCGTDAASAGQVKNGKLTAGNYEFGYITQETGTLAFAGKPALAGARLAFEQAEESGELGSGVKLTLTTRDSGGDQAKAIAAASSLIADDSVLGLLCCTSSTVTGAIQPIVDEAKIATSIASAVLPTATNGKSMYRVKPLLESFYRVMAPAVDKAYAPKTAAVTRTTDNDGMAQTANELISQLKQLGISVTVVDLLSTDKDMSGLATQIIDSAPDVVFHAELGSTTALSIRELVDRGYDGPQFGTDAMGSIDVFKTAGKAAVGVPFPATYFPASTDQATTNFIAAAQPTMGDSPSVFAAEGYSAARLLIEGLKKAAEQVGNGELTRAALVDGLNAVTSLDVPLGTIALDDRHQGSVAEPYLLQWNAEGTLVPWDGTADGRLSP